MRAALQTRLAYVITGDDSIDTISEEGLKGLNTVLRDRTSVDPGDPVGINIETRRDRLLPAALLAGPRRCDGAVRCGSGEHRQLHEERRHDLLRPAQRRRRRRRADGRVRRRASEALRRMLAKLDIPPLEPVPEDHVLTSTFYLHDRISRAATTKASCGWNDRRAGLQQRRHRRREFASSSAPTTMPAPGPWMTGASRSMPSSPGSTASASSPSAPESTS